MCESLLLRALERPPARTLGAGEASHRQCWYMHVHAGSEAGKLGGAAAYASGLDWYNKHELPAEKRPLGIIGSRAKAAGIYEAMGPAGITAALSEAGACL